MSITNISNSAPLQRVKQYTKAEGKISPEILETTRMIYQRANEENVIEGRNPEIIMAAALYAACRMENVPIQPEEISELASFSRRKVLRNYKLLTKELQLSIKPADPELYVNRYCDDLELTDNVRHTAVDIINACRTSEMSIGSPTGFAAGAVYAAVTESGGDVTQKEIADVAGKTPVTIRNWYKDQLQTYHTQNDAYDESKQN